MISIKKAVTSLFCILMLIAVPVFGYADSSYKDDLTGVTYSLPSGWGKTEFNLPKEFLSAKYKKGDSTIMFGSMDMWEMLDASAKAGYTRSDIDNDMLTDELLETLSGASDNNDISIYKKTYSSNEFVMIDFNASYTIAGYTVKAIGHSAYIVKDGYMITLQLQELEKSTSYEDFEYVLNSLRFPSVLGNASPILTPAPTPIKTVAPVASNVTSSKQNSISAEVVFLIVLIVLGTSVLLAMPRIKKFFRSLSGNNASSGSDSFPQTANDVQKSVMNTVSTAEASRKMVKCSKCEYVGSIDANDRYSRYKCPKCFSPLISMDIDKGTYDRLKKALTDSLSSAPAEHQTSRQHISVHSVGKMSSQEQNSANTAVQSWMYKPSRFLNL